MHIRRRDSVLVKRYLGDRAFFSRFLMIALPIAIQNGITNLVGLLDNVMVGQLGTMPMNGVSIVNQIMMVPYLCLFGAMAGAGIYTAQFFGSGDNDGIRFTFRFKGIACAFVVAGTMLFLSFYGANLIGLFLHSSDPQETEAALRYAMDYLRVGMWGLVPFGISQIYVSTMREVGQTVVPMKAGLAAVAVNVGLNYLLIFGKLGLPAMGVKGAALATICARCVEGCVAIVWLHTHGGQFPFVKGLLRSPRIPPRLFVQILVKCVPLLINEGMWSGGVTMMHQCYSTRGLDAVAGISICATLSDVFIVFFIAAGDAIAIMVGQLLGADKKEEAKDADRVLCTYSVLGSAVLGVVMALCAPFFPLLYHTSGQVRSLAASLIVAAALMLPIQAFTNASYFTLRSGGNTLVTFVFDGLFMWTVAVPLAYMITRWTLLPILPVYFFCQGTEIVKAAVGFVLVRKGIWVNNMTKSDKTFGANGENENLQKNAE